MATLRDPNEVAAAALKELRERRLHEDYQRGLAAAVAAMQSYGVQVAQTTNAITNATTTNMRQIPLLEGLYCDGRCRKRIRPWRR